MTEKPPKHRKHFVIIDGNHLVHRAFHAIQAPLQTSAGEPTNAVYGFASMLMNIIDLEKPDYLAVAFDEKGPTFRHKAHEAYKATRVKAPDELYAQIPRIREMLERFKVPLFSQEGFEADDLMGTLARKAAQEGLTCLVITGDMDAFQLIDPHTFVVTPHKGYREPIVYDAEKVKEKYGVLPEQIVDYKALMGDSSDNIKGVQGIGPKRASELLSRYNDLEGIYAHLQEIPQTIRVKLEAGRDDAFFARYLAKIVTDVPCELNLRKTDFQGLNFKGLLDFFGEVEIHSLQNRLKKIVPEEMLNSQEQLSLFG